VSLRREERGERRGEEKKTKRIAMVRPGAQGEKDARRCSRTCKRVDG
jgi:hypothetical protein